MKKITPLSFFRYYRSWIVSIKLFFKAGWLSILIIGIIVILLTQMGQGGTLVIDLLSHPSDVLSLIILTTGLSFVLSHFPDYIEKKDRTMSTVLTKAHDPELDWDMFPSKWCVGFITYSKTEKFKNKKKSKEVKRFDMLKRMLGTFLIWSVLYILMAAYQSYINHNFNLAQYTIISLILSFGHFAYIYKIRGIWKSKKRLLFFLKLGFWSSVLLSIVALYFSATKGWSRETFFSLALLYIVLVPSYNIFRNLRFILRFESGAKPYSLLSCDRNFVIFMGIIGWVGVGIFLAAQHWIFAFNPINIVLSILYSIYGLIIHPIKHQLFYANKLENGDDCKKCRVVRAASLYVVPIALVLFASVAIWTTMIGNELHTLIPVEETAAVNEVEYRSKLYDQLLQNPDSTIYFISSYGGGLMANAWNNLLLDTLSNFGPEGKNILNSTVSMSGVSGGAMGQGMYTVIRKNAKSASERRRKIDTIAKSNFLSLDLAYMFGKDYIREANVWSKTFAPNRCKRSMDEYECRLDDTQMSKLSFRQYWKEAFDKAYTPILLVNTASTHSTRGVSCPIKLDDYATAFPGADDILNLRGDSSLSFSDALSTTNRFPLLSAAAKIEQHGHFVDGGYFENSGMLTSINFYRYISADTAWQRLFANHKIIFIQIMNGKGSQIGEMVENRTDVIDKVQASGEISAVLKTITSIDGLPKYFNSEIKKHPKIKYATLTLPYYLRKQDVNGYLRSESTPYIDTLIVRHNREIDEIRYSYHPSSWHTAEPPLARLLSEPAFNYMKAVLQDGRVFHDLHLKINSE